MVLTRFKDGSPLQKLRDAKAYELGLNDITEMTNGKRKKTKENAERKKKKQ